MRLYHGSSTAIDHPDVARNTGFADLGQGFYLTDDLAAAGGRARSRARKDGAAGGVVSAFDFEEGALCWAVWDADGPSTPAPAPDASADPGAFSWQPGQPFGLRFAATEAGIIAWARYIKACRAGASALPRLGEPAVVRAWIATEEVEMTCSGLVDIADIARFIDPAELVVQYCFRDQAVLDRTLAYQGYNEP